MTPMWISVITTVLLRVPTAYGIAYLTRSEPLSYRKARVVFISIGLVTLVP